MAGRPAKPVEQHLAEGTFRPDRHNLPVVLGERDAPTAPAGLSVLQQKIWDDVVRELGVVLTTSDEFAVETFVVLVARARELRDYINEVGIGDAGSAVMNERATIAAIRPWFAELGLSPAARARLGLMAVQGKSALDKLNDALGENPMDAPPDVEGEIVHED